MSVTITGDKHLQRTLSKLERVSKNIDKDIVKSAAEVRNSIRRRTQCGQDYKGNNFVPYAASTISHKQATGRKTRANLSQTGEMLNAMQVDKISGGAKIHFKTAAERDKAFWNHYGTKPHDIRPKNKKGLANTKTGQYFGKVVHHPGTKPRKFFKLSKSNVKLFISGIEKNIRKAIHG